MDTKQVKTLLATLKIGHSVFVRHKIMGRNMWTDWRLAELTDIIGNDDLYKFENASTVFYFYSDGTLKDKDLHEIKPVE
jgi:hypothetical protein